jgi:hypothetical protein
MLCNGHGLVIALQQHEEEEAAEVMNGGLWRMT